jgi:two-component system chemotaxis sensor kinase CheA
MNAQNSAGMNKELLDDFFAEADEHLLGIRQALLQLEVSVDRNRPDPKTIEDLFRNFHSFKGISAIVGLGPAESVAHATEDFLRLLKGGRAALTAKGLEVLTMATLKLEQIVAAFRLQKPLPGYESLLADLRQQCGTAAAAGAPISAPSDTDVGTKVEEAKARGLLLWKYTFAPSQQLSNQGVSVNTVRDELSKSGEILKCTPLVRDKGTISFEFLVAAPETPADIAVWEAKGVTVHPEEPVENQAKAVSPTGISVTGDDRHNPFLTPSHVVRVDLKRLDELMRITGEMVIQRSRLDAQMARLDRTGVDLRSVQEVSAGLGRSLRELREAIMRVRLVPVAEIFARMPFVVRDLARQSQKKVRIRLEGQDTAIDKYLIERLKDPLLHVVRNAFTHGVETPEERAKASKPPEATIELKAANVGDSVIIQVRDDGRGLNPNAIIRRAKKLGLEVPDTVDNTAILNILCASGFSTRDDADRAAGRGVGMSVVQSTVRELGGNLTLESEEGRFTQFTLSLPLTLAIVETLIVRSAGQTCAVPQGFVREILQVTEEQIQIANSVEVVSYRSGILPVVRLSKLFRLTGERKAKMCMLVVSSERGSVGLLAEDVLGQREVVVRNLHDPLIQVPGISGATELGDGKPVLILDGAALTAGQVRPKERASLEENTEEIDIHA